MVYKIVDIHEEDGYYKTRKNFIGKKCNLAASVYESALSPNYQECLVKLENGNSFFFIGVRVFPNPLEEL